MRLGRWLVLAAAACPPPDRRKSSFQCNRTRGSRPRGHCLQVHARRTDLAEAHPGTALARAGASESGGPPEPDARAHPGRRESGSVNRAMECDRPGARDRLGTSVGVGRHGGRSGQAAHPALDGSKPRRDCIAVILHDGNELLSGVNSESTPDVMLLGERPEQRPAPRRAIVRKSFPTRATVERRAYA